MNDDTKDMILELIRPVKRFIKTHYGLVELDSIVSIFSRINSENKFKIEGEFKTKDQKYDVISDKVFESYDEAVNWIHTEFKNQIIEV